MSWLRVILAVVGILYEVLRCMYCGRKSPAVRKGETPKGWLRTPKGCVCPECEP